MSLFLGRQPAAALEQPRGMGGEVQEPKHTSNLGALTVFLPAGAAAEEVEHINLPSSMISMG